MYERCRLVHQHGALNPNAAQMQVTDSPFFRKIHFGQFVVCRRFQADTKRAEKRWLYQCGDFGQRVQRVAPHSTAQILQVEAAQTGQDLRNARYLFGRIAALG